MRAYLICLNKYTSIFDLTYLPARQNPRVKVQISKTPLFLPLKITTIGTPNPYTRHPKPYIQLINSLELPRGTYILKFLVF